MIRLAMERNHISQPHRFQLCKHCGTTPRLDEELPFIDQKQIEGLHRDKGRICKCWHCEQVFLEYDTDYLFHEPKRDGKGFEATDWVPLTEEESETENYRLDLRHIVTTRDHLYRRRDGSFAWRRLERTRKREGAAYALDEVSERAVRKGTGWVPSWDEMDGEERREYMDFLENITAEEKFLPPSESAIPNRTSVYEGEAAAQFLRDHQQTEEEILEKIKSERPPSEESQ